MQCTLVELASILLQWNEEVQSNYHPLFVFAFFFPTCYMLDFFSMKRLIIHNIVELLWPFSRKQVRGVCNIHIKTLQHKERLSCQPKNLTMKILRVQFDKTNSKVALTKTLRHSWWEDPAGGHEEPSRKSCCLKVPSSLALHTTFGFPISTCKWNQQCFTKKS